MIKIICFGKIKENYLNQLCGDYYTRIKKYHKIEVIELKDDNNIKKETDELNAHLKQSEYNIALDMNGNKYNSEEFACHIDKLFNKNSCITFIIGSSNGISKEIKGKCNELVSFSNFTMPHGLFRGVLLEQIYRTFKINNNESYHK